MRGECDAALEEDKRNVGVIVRDDRTVIGVNENCSNSDHLSAVFFFSKCQVVLAKIHFDLICCERLWLSFRLNAMGS